MVDDKSARGDWRRVWPRAIDRPWKVIFAMCVAGCLVLPLDVPVSRFCLNQGTPGEIRRMLDRVEFFGHGYGVLGIVITICVLTPHLRRHTWRVASCAMGAGVFADLIKLTYQRTRPCAFDFQAGVATTFRGFSLASRENRDVMFHAGYQSLPSAHTATAFGLAIALSWLYPRGKIWFLTLAILVAASRVDGGAHFLSDVCWGAACGYGFAVAMIRGRLAGWFARYEQQAATHSADQRADSAARRAA
jgi:membrane-associated phospholipid phosphatase